MERRYFPGLHVLRAYVALSVVSVHLTHTSYDWFGLTLTTLAPFWLGGAHSVTFFMVLSGFLITHILLEQQQHYGEINLLRFYERRARRILPLYYLVLFFSFALSIAVSSSSGAIKPNEVLPAIFLLYHIPFGLRSYVASFIGHFWSIGVEENFYLIVPILIRVVKSIPSIAVTLIVVKVAMTVIAAIGKQTEAVYFLSWIRVEAFAFGMLFAWLAFTNSPILKYIYRIAPIIIAIALAFVPVSVPRYGIETDVAVSLFSGLVIIIVSEKPRRWLENGVTRYIGSISYGIYLWHLPVIYLVSYLLSSVNLDIPIITHLCVYALTLALAALSYTFVEKPFLHLKKV